MLSVLKAEDCMTRMLVTAGPDMDAHEAIGLLLKHEISGMPVVDEAGKLVGILSEKNCIEPLLDAEYHELPPALVRDLMSTELTTVAPDTDVLKVADLFVNSGLRRLPVLEKDRLVGQISRRDVLRAIERMGEGQ